MGQITFKQLNAVASGVIAIVTVNETVILGPVTVTLEYDTARVLIRAWAQVTTGAGTTAITFRIRRGTQVTDPLIGSSIALPIGAAVNFESNIQGIDALEGVGQAQYVLTAQQTGAGGNGTAVNLVMDAEVISG